jgi:outer membrane biosynthesis protein TonB
MRKFIPIALLSAVMIGLASAQTPAPVGQTEAGKKSLAKIRQLGGLALELAQNDQHLEVSYIQTDGKFTDEHLALLKDLKGLVHLDLRAQPVTDAQLIHLKPLTELTRLHLEKTKITDKGLENLKGLVNLEYLNLYATEVSDGGLANLEGMKKLKHLYVWQTKVSEAGAAKLKKAIPGLDVNLGFKEEPIIAKKEEKKPEPKVVAKKEEKKPEPKVVAKKPEPKNDVKKPEAKVEVKKPEPAKQAKTTEEVTALLKARVELAEKTYRGVFEGLTRTKKVGTVLVLVTEDPEEVYTWSVRWLQAQRDLSPKQEDQIAALAAHLKRMTELKEVVKNLTRDLFPRIKEDEAEWYRLEAQIWLAKEKAKQATAAK